MRSFKGNWASLMLATAAVLVPATAVAQQDSVAQANALTESGKAAQAYALLMPQLAQRAGDPNYDLALGIAALDSGHYDVAIIALQRVIAVQPQNARAKAELARAYAAAGDVDTARQEFETVRGDPSIPDPVRQRIDGIIRNLDDAIAGGSRRLTGYVEAEAGFDSNINSATDATSITLPLFAFLGPATIGGASRAQDAFYYQLQAGLSGGTPLSRQTRMFGSVLGNWRDNVDSRFVDQASVVGTAGVAHTFASKDVIALSAQGQRFWLGHSGYRTSAGADLRYTKRLGPDRALVIAAQYFRLDYDGSPLQDADRYGGSITYADRTLYAGAGGGKEDTRRAGAGQLGYIFANAQLGGEWPVASKVAVFAGANAEYRNYDLSDPLFLKGREDVQFDASAGARFALTDTVSLRARTTYTRNESNIALYDYDRWTASIGVRFGF